MFIVVINYFAKPLKLPSRTLAKDWINNWNAIIGKVSIAILAISPSAPNIPMIYFLDMRIIIKIARHVPTA